MRALCATRPAEWWLDVPNDGNRLALLLCGVCPSRQGTSCTAGLPDPKPSGVIRGGLAYGIRGDVLPLCANPGCGYPNAHRVGGHGRNPLCHRCALPVLRRWSSRKRYWADYYQRRKAAA